MESELRMKMLLLIVSVLGTLAALTAGSMGQSTVPGGSGVPASPQAGLSDKSAGVLRTVASSNLFEIESSRLALARSRSNAIKEFADRMVGDHTRAANRVRQILGEMGASLPPLMLEPPHQQKLDALKTVDNPQFDKAYVEAQYIEHVEAIAVVREYARSGDNERLKGLAAEALAVLQSHLDHVTRLRNQR